MSEIAPQASYISVPLVPDYTPAEQAFVAYIDAVRSHGDMVEAHGGLSARAAAIRTALPGAVVGALAVESPGSIIATGALSIGAAIMYSGIRSKGRNRRIDVAQGTEAQKLTGQRFEAIRLEDDEVMLVWYGPDKGEEPVDLVDELGTMAALASRAGVGKWQLI